MAGAFPVQLAEFTGAESGHPHLPRFSISQFSTHWPAAQPYARILRLPDKRKYRNALRKLRLRAELSEHEKILLARSLAATPDERWKLNVGFLRSLGFSTLSAKRKLISR